MKHENSRLNGRLRRCKACGHDFISVSIVGPGFADAVPVYVKIARGRRSKGDLLDEAIEAVKAR